MSFPRYPKYKDSGVGWLGEVPEHWGVGPIKRVIKKIESGTSVNASEEPIGDGRVGVLKTSCVYTGKFDPRENKTVVDDEIGRVSCPLQHKAIIVSRMNTPDLVGAAGYVSQSYENLFLPDRLWQIAFSNVDPRLVYYWTLTSLYRAQVKAACTGTSSSMKNLAQDQFTSFVFASPRDYEQTAIVDFLDRETAKIDELVAEQRRLIELLKEKRQAVISHAMTKGLNPDAPMKDSGIEWLGEVPRHWSIVPAKRVVEVKDGTHATPTYLEPGEDTFPLITSKDFGEHSISFDDAKHISAEDHQEIVKRSDTERGDVLMSMIGGNIGKALIVDSDQPFSIKNVALFKTNKQGHLAKYVLFYLQSGLLDVQIDLHSRGGAQGFLGLGDIRNLVFFKVPTNEIEQIVETLESEMAKFGTLLSEAERAIELLQERRTALISDAVTGQIDVRELAKEEAA